MTKAVVDPKQREKFQQFLKAIKWGVPEHWVDIARAIGVHENTITAWKQHPEAQKAIRQGIERSLAAMEQAGAKDWHMWDRKLAMLGVNPATKVDAKVSGNMVHEILTKAGLIEGDDDGQTPQAS